MLLYGKFPLIDTIQPNNIVIHTTAWDLWRNSTWLSTDYEIHSLVQYGESGWGIVSHRWKGCSMISSMGSCPSGFLFERETIIIALKYFGVSLSLPLSLSLSPLSLSLSLSLSPHICTAIGPPVRRTRQGLPRYWEGDAAACIWRVRPYYVHCTSLRPGHAPYPSNWL